jgi:hypothetical protein
LILAYSFARPLSVESSAGAYWILTVLMPVSAAGITASGVPSAAAGNATEIAMVIMTGINFFMMVTPYLACDGNSAGLRPVIAQQCAGLER